MENHLNTLDLDIYDILELQENGFQKCLIPNELFTTDFVPGTLAICETNKQESFVCYIYSLRNNYPKDYCFLDESVQMNLDFNSKIVNKIIKITPIKETLISAQKLHVEVVINSKIFELNATKNLLEEIIKEWLVNFVLYKNCIIKSDEFLKSFGIENIAIKSDLQNPYEVNSETEIILQNVQYKEIVFEHTELRCLNRISEDLRKFITDFKLQKQFNWKMKPSFNALIIGPTGSGKSSICHNIFLEYDLNVFVIRPSDILRQYPGETEGILREISNNVKHFLKNFNSKSSTVVYIEDIEILCPAFASETDSLNMTRISSQIYSIFDDFHMNQFEVMVIATTSEIDKVNVQLRRPGRFEKEIQIHIPTAEDRKDLIELFLSSTPIKNLISTETLSNIVEKTPGFVATDLMLLIQRVLQSIILKKKSYNVNEIELVDLFNNALKNIRTASIKSTDITVYKCQETFDDIGGAEDLKNILNVSVLLPLKKPHAFKKFGLQLPKGILLYGPPGCAKTTIAKCLANETNMTFISISGAEVYSPFVGNAEKYIVKIFDTARRNSPCLIFFDEIETLVGKRTLNSKSDVQTRILSTLLQEMDGIGLKLDEGIKTHNNENHILVIGATNRPDMIDDALLRPGRFDKLIHVSAPNSASRLAILELCKKKMPFSHSLNLQILVDKTENFSGADLCNLCNEAALYAFTRDKNTDFITEDDFNAVLKELKPSLSSKQIDWYKNFESKYIS